MAKGKPCPFCGKTKVNIKYVKYGLRSCECDNCGVTQSRAYYSAGIAMRYWNRRTNK